MYKKGSRSSGGWGGALLVMTLLLGGCGQGEENPAATASPETPDNAQGGDDIAADPDQDIVSVCIDNPFE